MRLPAAAVQKGAKVVVNYPPERIEIAKVESATPEAGRITWTSTTGATYEVGGSNRIEIIELP